MIKEWLERIAAGEERLAERRTRSGRWEELRGELYANKSSLWKEAFAA
jgi:hypothetical protein